MAKGSSKGPKSDYKPGGAKVAGRPVPKKGSATAKARMDSLRKKR